MRMMLDKYDYVLLDIIYTYKKNNKSQLIKLAQLEANYWTRIEHDDARDNHTAQLGERIANLYLNGFIINKSGVGYTLTKKGKEELVEERMVRV
jgi:predicted transcriptional regulator